MGRRLLQRRPRGRPVRLWEDLAPVKLPLADWLDRLRSNTTLRQAALVFSASMLLNVCGFIFHAIVSRRIGVDAYGQLSALIAASADFALPAAVIAPVIARFSAEFVALNDDGHIRRLFSDLSRVFGVGGIILVAVCWFLATPIAAFLYVPVWSVPVVAVIAALLSLSGAWRAVAQGTQAFRSFALSLSTDGVIRVVALGALALAGLALGAGIFGFLIGSAAGATVAGFALLRRYGSARSTSIRYDWPRIAVSGLGAAATTIAMTLVGTVDVIVVKHAMAPTEAGLYAAASLGGKIVLYAVGFIPMVLLPQATDRHVRGERTRGALVSAGGLFLAMAIVGIGGVALFGRQMLHALVGGSFDGAVVLLVPYSIAMVLLALSNLLANYGIATHRIAFAFPLIAGTAGTLLTLVVVHRSLAQVVAVLDVGMAVTCLAVAVTLLWQGMRSRRLAPAQV
jgi:O-antigen/teichoic acid export membrane protein